MAERALCFKLELCAEMALVLDVRGYLLGFLVWVSEQAPGCLSDFSLVKSWKLVRSGAYPVLHIGACVKHTGCPCVSLFKCNYSATSKGTPFFLRDVTFLRMPAASDCQVIE